MERGRLLFVYVIEEAGERDGELTEAAWPRPTIPQQQLVRQYLSRYSKKREQRNQNDLLAAPLESYVHTIDLEMDRQDEWVPNAVPGGDSYELLEVEGKRRRISDLLGQLLIRHAVGRWRPGNFGHLRYLGSSSRVVFLGTL